MAAQSDTLFNRPYAERVEAIRYLYRQVIESYPDTVRAYRLINELRGVANRTGNPEIALEADLMEAYFDFSCLPGAPLRKIHKVVREARRRQIRQIACRGTFVIARKYWEDQDFERAFQWFASLERQLAALSVSDFPNKVRYLKAIGVAYYRFGDYRRALAHFRAATAETVPETFEDEWKFAMNNMGLVYRQLDSLEASDKCFRAVRTCNTVDMDVWEGIVSGNLAYNQYLRGNYEAAIPVFQRDIDIALAAGDYGMAAGWATPLADILIRLGMLDRAKPHIDSAYSYILQSGETDRLRFLFPVMNKWHAAAGHPAMAARYMDSTLAANKRYEQTFNPGPLLTANRKIMTAQRVVALQHLRTASQRKIRGRNVILGSLGLCLLAGVFWNHKQRKRRNLTPAEMRCLSMEKLRFSNKDMAALQGISTSTVMATKHRIRKKLGVPTHAELLELLQYFPR